MVLIFQLFPRSNRVMEMPGKGCDVLKALNLVHGVAKLFGVSPWKLRENGPDSGRLEFGLLLVNMGIHVAFFYFGYFRNHRMINYNRHYIMMSVIGKSLDSIFILATISYMTILYSHRKTYIGAVRRIHETWELLASQGVVIDFKDVKNSQVLYLAFSLTYVLILHIAYVQLIEDYKLLNVLSEAIPGLFSLTTVLFLSEFLAVLHSIRKLCNSQTNPNFTPQLQLTLHEIYTKITKVYEDIIWIRFVTIIGSDLSCSFYLWQAWYDQTLTVEAYFQFSWIVYNIIQLFTILRGCMRTCQTVKDLATIQRNRRKDLDLLKKMSLQMLNSNMEMMIRNAHVLDFTLLQTVGRYAL